MTNQPEKDCGPTDTENEPMTTEEAMAILGNARIRFWMCPFHRGRGDLVQWDDGGVARCLTCGETNEASHE